MRDVVELLVAGRTYKRRLTVAEGLTTRQVLALVREDGVPGRLPGESDFDLTAPHLGAAYEAAWLACRALASIVGEDGLVEVYRRTSEGEDVGVALAAEGTDLSAVTAAWQEQLRRAAR